jgi:hypothetical protein
MPRTGGGRRPQILGDRTRGPPSEPGFGVRGCRRRGRETERPGDPHRRRDRLLVRGIQEQAQSPRRQGGLHQQRPSAGYLFPEVSGDSRSTARRPRTPRVYPRECRCPGCAAILARTHGSGTWSASQSSLEAPQAKRPEGRTSATGITDASASTSRAAVPCTGRSRAGHRRPWEPHRLPPEQSDRYRCRSYSDHDLTSRSVAVIRRGVIGSPLSFGVSCPGSSPGAGTILLTVVHAGERGRWHIHHVGPLLGRITERATPGIVRTKRGRRTSSLVWTASSRLRQH